MKAIKTILGALAVASLLGFSFSASAQENNNRDENGKVVRGAYETNNFGSNWFIGVGAGVNSVYNNEELGKYGLAIDANLGKWFTPSVGARIGWTGVKNEIETGDGLYKDGNFDQFHYVHGDLLWNISNAFSGYKETRFWDFIPYVTMGGLYTENDQSDDSNWEYAAGVGLLNDFGLGGHVDLFLDARWLVAREEAYLNKGKYINFPTLTAGLIFNLGKSNWDRHSTITPVVVPLPFTEDQYNALKNRVAELEKENAALKNEIASLKNQAPDTVYVGDEGAVESGCYTFFDLGSSKLSAREKYHLDFYANEVASKLADDQTLVVTGSADSATGSAKTNARIAEARANAVKDYLVSKGVDASKVTVESLGGIDGKADARRVVTVVK